MGREIPAEFLEGYPGLLEQASATGRRLTREELLSRRALGERAASSGHGLRAFVAAHLSAARASWPGGADTAHVLATLEQAVDAFAEGYERAQRLAVRQEEAARREFIDDLLYGRSDLGRLAERAERFGLRLSRAHAVAVAAAATGAPGGTDHATRHDESDHAARQVEQALVGRFGHRRILVTTKDDRLVCVAPGDQDDVLTYFAKQAYAATEGSRVAIGRAHPGPGGVVHSYEEALNALDIADRMDLPGPLLRAAELLVFPVLGRDRAALADLVRSALGPLEEARGGAQPLLDTLSAYFDSGCNGAEAARRLRLSVRALTYRLDRVHSLTGSDPADPLHRYTLQTAVIGARLLDWPRREL
ncbi:helix-turn-helix domain-containing protein [Streptomyces sp. NPDC001941]|uniref:PucR family transcriptional regulator n=1 Tax=Streptomyces sp. NPDC001941 TaxID=3154659 RepID=UPI0033213279